MENLKILFLCPQPLWPVNTGARLRNFHLANALGAKNRVTVLQIVSPGESGEIKVDSAIRQVLSAVRGKGYTPMNMVRGLLGPVPVTVLNYQSGDVAETLRRTLGAERFDVVQLESIHLFPYLDVIRDSNPGAAVVLDWHNIESELMERFAESCTNWPKKVVATRTARLLRGFEQQALERITTHTVVSEREREKVLARAPRANIQVVGNGVDAAYYAGGGAGEQTLLFVGSMDYHANSDAVIWFGSQVWPALAAEFPALNFKIVGRNPPESVKALVSARITVTGTVEDVRPFYQEAFAVVVPLRVGGGTRLKILEAMAAGVPVISSRLGAEGLAVQDGREILLADDLEGMRRAVRTLMEATEPRARICAAARELVRTQYDWAVLGENLAAVYESVCS